MPHCCIGVDVIVGFPGESESDFIETYDFINELDVSYLHVFTYSERANTLAVELEGKVDMSVRRNRNERLRILSEKKRAHFYQQFEGDIRPVLFEHSKEANSMSGYTDNYIKVSLPLQEYLINQIEEVKIGKFLGGESTNATLAAVLV